MCTSVYTQSTFAYPWLRSIIADGMKRYNILVLHLQDSTTLVHFVREYLNQLKIMLHFESVQF